MPSSPLFFNIIQFKLKVFGIFADVILSSAFLGTISKCSHDEVHIIFQPLDESIKDELSSNFEDVILAMLKAPRELDAIMIHDAMAVSYNIDNFTEKVIGFNIIRIHVNSYNIVTSIRDSTGTKL